MQAHVRHGENLVLEDLPYCKWCHEEMVDAHFEEHKKA
jgi:hypothetical protein